MILWSNDLKRKKTSGHFQSQRMACLLAGPSVSLDEFPRPQSTSCQAQCLRDQQGLPVTEPKMARARTQPREVFFWGQANAGLRLVSVHDFQPSWFLACFQFLDIMMVYYGLYIQHGSGCSWYNHYYFHRFSNVLILVAS